MSPVMSAETTPAIPEAPREPGPLLAATHVQSWPVALVVAPVTVALLLALVLDGWSARVAAVIVGTLVAAFLARLCVWLTVRRRYGRAMVHREAILVALSIGVLQRKVQRIADLEAELGQLREDHEALKRDARTKSGEEGARRLAEMLAGDPDSYAHAVAARRQAIDDTVRAPARAPVRIRPRSAADR
jgi:hypothetical protein